jgi:hypothetical protein
MQEPRRQIQNRINTELGRVAGTGAQLKGTVSQVRLGQRRRDNSPRTAYLLTYKGKGNKTRSIYVPASRVAEAKRLIEQHRKAKTILDRVVELSIALFKTRK